MNLQKIALLLALSLPSLALADTYSYSVIFGQKKVGHLTAETKGDTTTIDFDIKNNGRGPTDAEIDHVERRRPADRLDDQGRHHLRQQGRRALHRKGPAGEWTDSTGKGTRPSIAPTLYVAQSGSPWGDGIIAKRAPQGRRTDLPACPAARCVSRRARP